MQKFPDDLGGYAVTIPLKPKKEIGNSKAQATVRFLNLEEKFQRNPKLKEEYEEFIKEYLDLGHMIETKDEVVYYLPHQAVVKE